VFYFCVQFVRPLEQRFGSQKLLEEELVKLSERSNTQNDMTLFEFKEMVLYLLDTATNLSLFLDIYNPACSVFHQQLFEIK
jgi:hypothetical protein